MWKTHIISGITDGYDVTKQDVEQEQNIRQYETYQDRRASAVDGVEMTVRKCM